MFVQFKHTDDGTALSSWIFRQFHYFKVSWDAEVSVSVHYITRTMSSYSFPSRKK